MSSTNQITLRHYSEEDRLTGTAATTKKPERTS